MTKKSTNQKRVRLALRVAAITAVTVITTITGCGGNGNPGGGDRFTTFTLTTGVSPENSGTLSRDPHATSYQNGAAVTLTANPAAGFRFAGWSDTSLHQVTPITIAMTRNMNITANFVSISTPDGYTLSITRSPETGGTITRSPDLTHYPAGTEVTLTANIEPGYAFDGWSGAVDTSIRIITVTMDGDKELTAHFLPAPHKLTTSATTGGRVTVDPEQESYAHNARVTATAHADTGYVFVRWTGASALSSNPVTITMSADRELNAIFELIGDNHFTLTIGDLTGGTVLREPDKGSYALGEKVVVRAIPDEGFRFTEWTGDLRSVNEIDTITITNDMVLIAQFQQVRTLTINRVPNEGGTVTPESGAGHDINNPVVDITATPNDGYRFVNWTMVSGTATIADSGRDSTTILLNSDATITANFQQTCTLWIDQSGVVGGSVSTTSGLRHDAGRAVSISATANAGYRFLNWTVVNGTATFDNANNASTRVTLSSNATIRANFEWTPYTLTISSYPTAGGTLTPESGQRYDFYTMPVTITANAASGYIFNRWMVISGQAIFDDAYNASTRVTLNSDATIRANFWQTSTFTDLRDNQVYRTVTIGSQTWMAENLNWAGEDGDLGSCYNNSPDSCAKYGRIYDWMTVMDLPSSCRINLCADQVQSPHRGICPAGWHVPSGAEWEMLVNFVGSNAAAKLKSTTGWGEEHIIFGRGTDDFGFSALPGNTDHGDNSSEGRWWSATEWGNDARHRRMNRHDEIVGAEWTYKAFRISLRCLKDD
jgi:uncharacterized protein (TIGR02145 family)/uncharacterized repeat protein (TIGR02543 family)